MKETNAQQLKRYRLDAVARGLCYICRCRFPRPGVRSCDECLERSREYKKAGGREAERRRSRRSSARRRARFKAAGICTRCERNPAVAGYVSCSVCLDASAERALKINLKAGGKPSQSPCSVCGRLGHHAPRHLRPGVIP